MFSREWQARLDRSSTAEDVANVCNHFLDACGPNEIARLPEELRPKPRMQGTDVNAYALRLIEATGAGRDVEPTLYRVSTFFTKAALRLAQIRYQDLCASNPQRAYRSRSS